MMPLQKDNWFPFATLEPPIDAIALSFHLSEEVMIALDMRAAWGPYLYESELSLINRVLFEQSLNGEETFDDAFRVVDAIHTHTEEQRLDSQFPQEGSSVNISGPIRVRGAGRIRNAHADWKRLNARLVAATVHGKVLPIDAGFECTIDGLQKISAVGLNVKSNQVCP